MSRIYDMFQNFRIDGVARVAGETSLTASANKGHLRNLQDKVDYLSLVNLAMIECLKEMGFTEEMILKKIERLDALDGQVDGKLSTTTCKSCQKKVSPRHYTCIYCGNTLKAGTLL